MTPFDYVTKLSKSEMLFLSTVKFALTPKEQLHFAQYYVHHYDAFYALEQINYGVMWNKDHCFLVVYQGITPQHMRKNPYNKVKCSFRRANKEYELSGYVIIQPVFSYDNATNVDDVKEIKS
jgi:hypothetical protein